MSGEMESLRRYYNVPAKRGQRVAFTGFVGQRITGRIISARAHKFYIRTDHTAERLGPLHPTWEIEYLNPDYSDAA